MQEGEAVELRSMKQYFGIWASSRGGGEELQGMKSCSKSRE